MITPYDALFRAGFLHPSHEDEGVYVAFYSAEKDNFVEIQRSSSSSDFRLMAEALRRQWRGGLFNAPGEVFVVFEECDLRAAYHLDALETDGDFSVTPDLLPRLKYLSVVHSAF